MPHHQDPPNDKDHDNVIPLEEGTDQPTSTSLDQEVPDDLAIAEDVAIEMVEDEDPTPPAVEDMEEPAADYGQPTSSESIEVDVVSTVESPEEAMDVEEPASIIADGEAIITPPDDHGRNAEESFIETPIPPLEPSEAEAEIETTAPGETVKATGWRQRFRGKTGGDDEGLESAGLPLSDLNPASAASTNLHAIREFFDPGFAGIDLRWTRRTVGGAAVLVIALLLANQAGAALIIASAVIPILAVMLLAAHDLYERESPILLLGVGVAGGVAGIVLGSIASWIVSSQWFDEGHLNFGAGGFGGKFAQDSASFLVWLVVGLLLPAATVAGLAAAPLLMRRWPQFANEVMDGMILAGSSAAGVAIGLSSTFWWPMTYGDGPLMDVSDWTLTIAGQVLLRPLVITLSGALIGAGVWRYMLHLSGSVALILPAVGGVVGIMALSLGSLALQPSGIWPEFLLTLVLAGLVFAAYRKTLESSIETDAAAMGASGERMICPHCHLITPPGEFCGRCGKPLHGVDPAQTT